MKRIIPLLFLLLTLWGCGAEPAPPTETSAPTAPPETAPAEPTGFYDPRSELERSSGGAIQAYPLNREDCTGMLPMGQDILLFSGTSSTTLTRLSGENLYITAETRLSCAIDPEDPGVQASEKGVTYYDSSAQDLVFLDASLKEANRVSLPDDIIGSPTLSADRKSLYYCTADAVRVLDLETGFHKLLKEMFFASQTIAGLHCDDTVLECGIVDSDGNARSLFFSAQTGETLWETLTEIDLTTRDDAYFALQWDGAYPELLTGTTDIGPYALYYDDPDAIAVPLLEQTALVLITTAEDGSAVTLHYFDLESGRRTAQLELFGSAIPSGIHCDPADGSLRLLRHDESYGYDTICRWHPELTPTGDETVYITDRRTAAAPDTEGLAACQQRADSLSNYYGVTIRLWTDAVSETPDDHILTAEYQVPLIQSCLDRLEQALARYPDGFLKNAARGTSCGTIQICLVRSIEGEQGSTGGLQFWNRNEDAYVCIAAGADLERNLHHELFHVIDSRVMSTCSAYDGWASLNPEGFAYAYSFEASLLPEDESLTEGETRAFIDRYSMSFPKEDRARIMEYAMTPGNESCFASPVMQSKLRTLCAGIREAFGFDKYASALPWEQYLEEPLY